MSTPRPRALADELLLPLGPALERRKRLKLPIPPAPLNLDTPAAPRARQLPLWRIPLRRHKAPKPRSIGRKPLTKEELDVKRRLDHLDYPSLKARRKLPVLQMPSARSGCAGLPRPCPFIHCAHNNYLTETGNGVLKVTYPDLLPHQMDPDYSCAEDMRDRGPSTVEEVSYALNMTEERTRQITVSAFRKIKSSEYGREMLELWLSGDL